MEKTEFIVELLKPVCIGCKACVKMVPEFWYMEKAGDLQKSCLKNSKNIKSNGKILKQAREITEAEFKRQIIAASVCPVSAISIYNKKTKEKVDIL